MSRDPGEQDEHGDVTRLLARLGGGDERAADELFPLVYRELRAAAARCMRREAAGHTLQTTALVHEAYLRLMGGAEPPGLRGRDHFLRVAAKAMRHVLVDHAREKRADKRGAGRKPLPLDAVAASFEERSLDLLELHETLEKLGRVDAELARVSELRLFGGLTMEQIAAALDRSLATIERAWAVARLWIRRELSGEPG